ncbi:MAG: hypothetical protein ACKVQK_23250 [Burkholderiales bacterium]
MTKTLAAAHTVEHGIGVIKRAKGYYWRDIEEGKLQGPFASRQKALENYEDRAGFLADDDGAQALTEFEDLIGIADWIDPDTGMPAEESTPRLDLH